MHGNVPRFFSICNDCVATARFASSECRHNLVPSKAGFQRKSLFCLMRDVLQESKAKSHFVEKSRSTIGSGPVDPPTLAGRSHPEQTFHRSAACVVVERSSTLVKAACMPRLAKPEAL